MSELQALRDMLTEFRSKLNLDGSSIVLVPDEETKLIVEDVCKASYLTYLPSVTVASSHGERSDAWAYKEEQFTHIFSHINETDKPALQDLKWIQWSLKYKGIAIFTVALSNKKGQQDRDSLVNFIENASFERGRIKIVEKQGAAGQESLFVIAMKWDLLCA